MTKTLVTFSIWSRGQLLDRRYVTDEDDPDTVSRIALRQGDLCASIDNAGGTYLVEVAFWDGEHVRWGTDVDGMVVPMEAGLAQLSETIERMRRERGTA